MTDVVLAGRFDLRRHRSAVAGHAHGSCAADQAGIVAVSITNR
ncbi:hypothetical protein [Microbacterium lacus]